MAYQIRHCRWESGERYCMMVDPETGLPPWWPTLYITTQVRNRGQSVATMEQALRSIGMLLAYAEAEEIDLEERVRKRRFLAPEEIDGLCDSTQRKIAGIAGGGKPETVSPAHQHNRLGTIARYLEWFAREMLREHRTQDDDKATGKLANAIRHPSSSRENGGLSGRTALGCHPRPPGDQRSGRPARPLCPQSPRLRGLATGPKHQRSRSGYSGKLSTARPARAI